MSEILFSHSILSKLPCIVSNVQDIHINELVSNIFIEFHVCLQYRLLFTCFVDQQFPSLICCWSISNKTVRSLLVSFLSDLNYMIYESQNLDISGSWHHVVSVLFQHFSKKNRAFYFFVYIIEFMHTVYR